MKIRVHICRFGLHKWETTYKPVSVEADGQTYRITQPVKRWCLKCGKTQIFSAITDVKWLNVNKYLFSPMFNEKAKVPES